MPQLRRLYDVSAGSSRSLPMEGIRGLAVLLVFFVHFHAIFSGYFLSHGLTFELSRFFGLTGNTGVDLFFVLSGYLIYGVLLRKDVSYLKFIRRRVVRIFPTFLCVLFCYFVLFALLPNTNKVHGPLPHAASEIAANLLLLPGVFHITTYVTVAWSLSYEFFFYLTIPLVVRWLRMRNWRGRTRTLFFAGVCLCYMAYSFTVTTSHVRMLMFVWGIVLYETVDSESLRFFLKPVVRDVLPAAAFVGSLVVAYGLDRHAFSWILPRAAAGNTVLPGVISVEGPYKVIAVGFGSFLLVLSAIAGRGLLARLFCWTPLRYLGNMSYSYYLIHGAALNALAVAFRLIWKPGYSSPAVLCLILPAAFATTWVASTVLFALVEKPISLRQRPSPAKKARAIRDLAVPDQASVTIGQQAEAGS